MITERHKISLKEISSNLYNQIKSKQKIKPTTIGKPGAIFGLTLTYVSYSIRNFCKQVEEEIREIEQIKGLFPRKINSGRIVYDKKLVYLLTEEEYIKEYNTLSGLEGIIKEGKGIYLIFRWPNLSGEEGKEIHHYKLMGENLLLVEVKIPRTILNNGFYTFTRTTNNPFEFLKATYPEKIHLSNH